jgi:hypothetical protein
VTPSIGPLTEDIDHLKGRIGEAFVEALLRRGNYFVTRVGRETHLPSLMKVGPTTYMPDFLAWREERIPGPQGDKQVYNIVAVEVKYRRQPERFLRDEALQVFDAAQGHWPNFCVVLVTDHPEDDRSCFQVLRRGQGSPFESVDIADAGFNVFPHTAMMFSSLLKQVFHSLNEASGNLEAPRGSPGPS